MSVIYRTIVVSAPFVNSYASVDGIAIEKKYRLEKGFEFTTTLEQENGRWFIENIDTEFWHQSMVDDDSAIPFGRWVPAVACKIKNEEIVEDETSPALPYDGEPCDVHIRLLGDTFMMASSVRGPVTETELFKNSVLECDYVSYVIIDGIQQVRYHINVCDYERYEMNWVLLDGKVMIDYDRATYKEHIVKAQPDSIEYSDFAERLEIPTFLQGDAYKSSTTSTSTSKIPAAPDYLKDPTALVTAVTGYSEELAYIDNVNLHEGYQVYVYLATKKNTNGTIVKEVRKKIRKLNGETETFSSFRVGSSMTLADVRVSFGGMSENYANSTQNTYYTKTYQDMVQSAGEEVREEAEANADGSTVDVNWEDYATLEEYGGGDYSAGVVAGDDGNGIDLNTDSGYQTLMEIYDLSYSDQSLMSIPLDRMNFVHGIPFQFSAIADRRRGSTNGIEVAGKTDLYGIVYAREVLAQIPIVVFAPGEPQFLSKLKTGFFGNAKSSDSIKDMWMPLISTGTNEHSVEAALEKIQNEGGTYDYYTMDIKLTEYYDYVNMLCKMCARNMGLTTDLPLTSGEKNPMHINWNNYNIDVDVNCSNDSILSVLGLNQGVSFAFDPQSSITDSISTSTTESQVAGLLNQISSTARELGFVTGQVTEGAIGGTNSDTDWNEVAASYKSGWTGGNMPVLDSIGRYINNISNGLNVRFPEIWSDSTQTKSYSCDMHFISPYAHPISVWRHVLVPFWHIFALSAPRSRVTINAYDSPFLIRAFSKGYFNVEMGIIEAMSYKRFGDGDMITANGVPTQIDVTVDFKDMYHMLAITPYSLDNMGLFFNNAGLIELIGTLSGINMNRLGLSERLSLYVYAGTERVRTLGSNFMQHVRDRTRNIVESFYYGV